MSTRWVFLACVLVFGALAFSEPQKLYGRSEQFLALEPLLTSPELRGAALFAFGDWGGLTSDTLHTTASAWKLMVAALAIEETGGNVETFDAAATFQRFGLLSPTRIGNWPDALPAPQLSAPLGQVTGLARGRLLPAVATIGNAGCALCHAGVMYTPDGRPDIESAWLGMPNTSINLEALSRSVYAALQAQTDPESLMDAVGRLFPATTWMERLTLRTFVLPQVRAELADRASRFGTLLPFHAGLPGATNGIDALRWQLGLIAGAETPPGRGATSIPDLGARLWRRTLLSSGSYVALGGDSSAPMTAAGLTEQHRTALSGIIAFFTVPSMGVTPQVALGNIPNAFAVTAWMSDYAPQPFPGEVAADLLPEGRDVYARHCADCHGLYDSSLEAPALISFPNWEGSVGTSPVRAKMFTQDLVDAVNSGPFGAQMSARVISGYAAPPLAGIWASAPYLHNGSVPTLWHLMRPETRPARFEVGGHSLDFAMVGIAGAQDGETWQPTFPPWSLSFKIDTGQDGFSNAGHEKQFAPLTEAQKTALLEYLKLL